MLQIKSAQSRDFADVDVRRILGYMADVQFAMQSKLDVIERAFEAMDGLKMNNPNISLQEIQQQFPSIWNLLEQSVGNGHWSLNP